MFKSISIFIFISLTFVSCSTPLISTPEGVSIDRTGTAETYALMETEEASTLETPKEEELITVAPTYTTHPTNTPRPTRRVTLTLPPTTDLISFTCSGAPLTRLNVGSQARVTFTDGTPGSIRDAPASATVLGKVPEGVGMKIIAGPVCDNQRVWWCVVTDNGYEGWISEGKLGEYWIEPIN